MKLIELFSLKGIDLNTSVINKNEAIDYLIELMMANNNIIDKTAYKQEIISCENQCTKVLEEVVILHIKTEYVIRPGISAIVIKDGINYNPSDGLLTRVVFMIAIPKDNENIYQETLRQLSKMLIDHDFKNQLINTNDSKEFLSLFDTKESVREKTIDKLENRYDVLAVTACPMGISHLFMATENLKKKAEEMKISFKVETIQAIESKNILTKTEIEKAKCIIIATDKQIDMARFDGKPVIFAKLSDAITNAEILLEQALSDEIKIYNFQDETEKRINKYKTIFKKLYIQLSEGINNVLPVLIGVGALISIATLAVTYNIFNISTLTDNVWIANSYVFGNAIQGMIVALLAGFIGQTIASRIGFASGFGCGVATQLNVIYLNDVNNPGILGGIIAGFIGGYMVIFLQWLCRNMPKQFDRVKTMTIYPIFSIMMAGVIIYLISPYIGSFNHIIAILISEMNLPFKLILGIILGTMIAVDIDGPINKIVYIFGISQILEGNLDVMAAVMAGGMVPPLAIAFATSFFEDKFTNQERERGQDNFLNGLLFSSKGVIPFIHKDPQLVTVICIVASSIASGLTMIYNCGLRIPHGGIFVLPLISHPLRFLVALLAGSICGGAIYGLWKENSDK